MEAGFDQPDKLNGVSGGSQTPQLLTPDLLIWRNANRLHSNIFRKK